MRVHEDNKKAIVRHLACLVCAFIMAIHCQADSIQDKRKIPFHIPQQRADSALTDFAEQADLTLIFPFDEVQGKSTNRVVGRYSIKKAIGLLLKDTGLEAFVSEDNQLTIITKPSPGGSRRMFKKNKLSTATIATMASVLSINAHAQTMDSSHTMEEVIVTGYRSSLTQALAAKRESTAFIDSIVAEDIADFPDLNLADSMARIPGVNIDRAGGEGKQISVRGLSADFTRVQINGMETMSAGDDNTSRAFDFNMFASELFNRIDVQKSQTADVDEGSLGATVHLYTGRPFDYDEFQFVTAYQQGYNDLSKSWDPRATALISVRNEDSTLGASFSVAYSDRTIFDEGYNTDVWEANTNTGANHWANWGGADNLQDYDTALHPRFPRYRSYTNEQKRLGVTGSLQWRPADRTLITTDLLYSKMDASQYFPGLTPISLSRTTNTGRMETVVRNPVVVDGVMIAADLDGVDFRSETFLKEYETEFTQLTVNLEHEFSDDLRLNALIGTSKSENRRSRETTIILEAFNRGMSYAYENERDQTPLLNFDFDLTDPSNYYISELRDRPNFIDNEFDTVKVDLEYDINDAYSVKGGLAYKEFSYYREQFRRDRELIKPNTDGVIDDGDIASLPADCNLTLADLTVDSSLGYISQFGKNLDIPTGMTQNRHFVGDVGAVDRHINFYNNDACFPLTSNIGSHHEVTEEDYGGFVQLEWHSDIAGIPFSGNVGVRYAKTNQEASAWQTVGGTPIWVTVDRDYSDVLPSINLVLEPVDNLLLRASWSEVMSRPTLSDLTPGGNVDGFNRKVSFGNPQLDPFRADAYDVSAEWYFTDEALLSLAYFRKEIDSFIVSDTRPRLWSDLGLPDSLLDKQPATPQDTFDVSSKINGGGGILDGWELQYQQAFSFLPGFLGNTGIKANYTIIDSRVAFGTDTAGNPIYGTLDGTSKNSWNATLWYENQSGFNARISWSYRSKYQRFPNSRTKLDGMDFIDEQTYVDFSASYDLNENLRLSFEALNLTDEYRADLQSARRLPGTTSHFGTQYFVGVQYTY